jgi:hypothetical protein
MGTPATTGPEAMPQRLQMLLYCCFTAALLLLYCCFTAALPATTGPEAMPQRMQIPTPSLVLHVSTSLMAANAKSATFHQQRVQVSSSKAAVTQQ